MDASEVTSDSHRASIAARIAAAMGSADMPKNDATTNGVLDYVVSNGLAVLEYVYTPKVFGGAYFIRAATVGMVKIGCSSNITKRLAVLRGMSPVPLQLLGVVYGRKHEIERLVHRRFSHLRSHGEWFRETPELLAFIAKVAKPAKEGKVP